EGMAEAAIALLAEPERLRAMGRASRRLAEERFCASHIIPLYEDLYARVVSGNHAAARPSR
ncbi:MAG: hypothetical protein ACRD2F_06220, partial [Terriglobales bacterium]